MWRWFSTPLKLPFTPIKTSVLHMIVLLSSEQTFFNSLVNLSSNLGQLLRNVKLKTWNTCGCHSTRRLISPDLPAWHFSLHPSQLLQQPEIAYQTEFESKTTKSYHFAIHLCIFIYLFSQKVRSWIILFHIKVSRIFWSLNLSFRSGWSPFSPINPYFWYCLQI